VSVRGLRPWPVSVSASGSSESFWACHKKPWPKRWASRSGASSGWRGARLHHMPNTGVASHAYSRSTSRISPCRPDPRGRRQAISQPVWHVPLRRNLFFTGRQTVLQRLAQSLLPRDADLALHALTGMGGVGKTQTALECYDMCRAGWDQYLPSLRDYLETGNGHPFTATRLG
jgi:hypothetical protein